MRSLLIISSLTLIASCTFPWSTSSPQAPIEYARTQSGSPAAVYCSAQGGQVSYEKNPTVPTMDFIYCTTATGGKMDAWKYMNDTTVKTGTGLPL